MLERIRQEAAFEVALPDDERNALLESRSDDGIQITNLACFRRPTKPQELVKFTSCVERLPTFDERKYAERLNRKFTRLALQSLLEDVSWYATDMPILMVGLRALTIARVFAKKFQRLGFSVQYLDPPKYLLQLEHTRETEDYAAAHAFEKAYVQADLLILNCPTQITSDDQF